jgi:hypothetical protein
MMSYDLQDDGPCGLQHAQSPQAWPPGEIEWLTCIVEERRLERTACETISQSA